MSEGKPKPFLRDIVDTRIYRPMQAQINWLANKIITTNEDKMNFFKQLAEEAEAWKAIGGKPTQDELKVRCMSLVEFLELISAYSIRRPANVYVLRSSETINSGYFIFLLSKKSFKFILLFCF